MKGNNKSNKNLAIILLVVGVLIIVLSVLLSLKSNGKGVIGKESKWDVQIAKDSYKELSGSVKASNVEVNGTTMRYTVPVKKVGDFYEATINVVNNGTIDAKMDTITINGLTEEQKNSIQHTITYGKYSFVNTASKLDYTLKAGDTTQVRIFVLVNGETNLEGDLNLEFNLNFIKKEATKK